MQEYTHGAPIYLQILEDIRHNIVSGRWPPGMRVPPVRELSLEFGVNPNTAQRSLAELEREGLVYTERTAGRFITDDAALIEQVRQQMADSYTSHYLQQMQKLGYPPQELAELLRQNHTNEEETP